ncbi:uncharacterized protein LOC114350736 [Ostrinia furnacalis]|uniref:uncharacterized protein LOC114350736 n=1 Tax=Ostrinia furnacalis TaxID=93504 RepID=UPI00103C1E8E|nr:uncharacterized protein LOC114350736 [Ostrinia furnacalis]
MFKRNDHLVSQERLYKERVPFRRMHAKYLKVVHCPITYLRVIDRLGVGAGPTVKILRGGLLRNHVYLYIISQKNQPISVTIYIGCENKATTTTTVKVTKEEAVTDSHDSVTDNNDSQTNSSTDSSDQSSASDLSTSSGLVQST